MFNLHLSPTELSAGQQLCVNFMWMGQNAPKEIQILIGWRTEGRGTVDTDTLYENSFVGDSGIFTYQIPPTGPYSYDGQLLRVIWEVSASVKFDRFWRQNEEKFVTGFRVLPR